MAIVMASPMPCQDYNWSHRCPDALVMADSYPAMPMPQVGADWRHCGTLAAAGWVFMVPVPVAWSAEANSWMPAAYMATCATVQQPQAEVPGRKQDMERFLRRMDEPMDSYLQIASELQGQVRKFALNKVGCQVLQRLLATLPLGHAGALVDELIGMAWEVSQHKYGSRVVCALIEHQCSGEQTDITTMVFMDELLECTHELMVHTFGHRAICAALERGSEHHRLKILTTLRMAVVTNAQHPHCSFVVAKALECASSQAQDTLCSELLRVEASIAFLAETHEGCKVIRALMKFAAAPHKAVVVLQLCGNAVHVQATRHGRRLVNDLNILGAAERCSR